MQRQAPITVIISGAGGFVGRALAARLTTSPLAPMQRMVLVDSAVFPCATASQVIVGDLCSPATIARIVLCRPDLVFHLASIPGGAAEVDSGLSRRVNLDASMALIEALSCATQRPRLIYASSIGVFGVPLPAAVDDDTIARPALTYGAHKLMVEIALADAVRRGALSGLALRLPAVVARPAGRSGLKSAFMSDVFDHMRNKVPITLPVSADGHVWIASIAQCIDNLVAAAVADLSALRHAAITMPALRAAMGEIVAEIAEQTGANAALVRYAPEVHLQAQFAAYPPLSTAAGEAIGLRHDGTLRALVGRTLRALAAASTE